jgi:hypothetical protein
MNWKVLLRLVFIALITNSSFLFADEPVLSWHTNMGSVGQDLAEAIAVDGSGNIYVAGWTESTWGTPIHPYAGGRDAFVAKLNSSGERLWHTFMGSSGWDEARSVAVDGDGNIYVVGTSEASWGTPVYSYAGWDDIFAVKLNSDGERQWHTFMGDDWDDWGAAIAVDTSGTVYVAGTGSGSWDTAPVNPTQGGFDVLVTKLSTDGVRQWYTYVGSAGHDINRSMAVDGSGNVYVVGMSEASWGSWGSPVNPYAGEEDAFVAKLNNNGERLWHTFMGSAGENDAAMGVAVDGSSNVYISGSGGAWGTPINPFLSEFGGQGFAAKLNSSGIRQWHTFLGSEGLIFGWGLAIDESRNIFTGDWWSSVQLSPDGIIQRHFAIPHGGPGEYQPIAVDTSGNVYFGGGMDEHWWIEPISTAIVPWTDGGGWDACVVKFETSVEIDIDIKPGGDPNSINLCSDGAVPIAILGSDTFDVYDIDTETLRFAEASVKVVGMKDPHSICSYEDVNDDIFYDLVCHFLTADIAGIDGQSSTATVNGELLNGTPFEGTDIVNIVKDTCN